MATITSFPKATERSLYPALIQHLNSFDVGAAQETLVSGYPDLIFEKSGKRYLIEVKLGASSLLEGVAQLERNARVLNTDQKMLLVYPESVRIPLTDKYDERLIKLAIETPLLYAGIFTDFLTEVTREKTAKEVFIEFFENLNQGKKTYKPSAAIETLRDGVIILSDKLRALPSIELLENEVAGKLDLFTALGETGESEEEFRNSAVDLASYILINQILFYRIFSERTQRIEKLDVISSVNELKEKFNQIQSIDFAPIFRVNVINALPNTKIIITTLVNLTSAISSLKPEMLEHDLMGRLFHDLLPFKTRKTLAAFYTRPIAAQMLAYLAIDNAEETIIDPACGSGTLLVAAYHRKKSLSKDKTNIHSKFVEQEITGVDIMPFAAHLTAVNLASQNVDVVTNNLRIASHDSLKIKTGMALRPLEWQLALFSEDSVLKSVEIVEGEKSGEFQIGKSDVLLMNPPFTKTKRLPETYKKDIQKNWGKLSGNSVGLWGHFIFLADTLIKDKGKIGGIVPINLLRGRESSLIRKEFLSGRYRWLYIVRATKNYAFSESSEYSDIIWVVKKSPSNDNDLTAIVLIKENLANFSIESSSLLSGQIAAVTPGKDFSGKFFDLFWVDFRTLKNTSSNLMPLVAISSLTARKTIQKFIDCVEKHNKVSFLEENLFAEGFRPVPEGLSELVFITNDVSSSRLQNATLDMISDEGNEIKAKITELNLEIEVPKDFTLKSLRTPVGLPTMDVSNNPDYLITAPYNGYEKVKAVSKFKGEPDWKIVKKNALLAETNLVLCRRINPYSPSQYFFAFYSESKLYPSNQLELVKVKGDAAKIMCLFFNSTYFLTQFILNKEESTGRRVDIRISDLINIKGPNLNKLNQTDKKELLDLFDSISKKSLPSIMDQIKNQDKDRVKLDLILLKTLGVKEEIAKEILSELYPVLIGEMERVRGFAKD